MIVMCRINDLTIFLPKIIKIYIGTFDILSNTKRHETETIKCTLKQHFFQQIELQLVPLEAASNNSIANFVSKTLLIEQKSYQPPNSLSEIAFYSASPCHRYEPPLCPPTPFASSSARARRLHSPTMLHKLAIWQLLRQLCLSAPITELRFW